MKSRDGKILDTKRTVNIPYNPPLLGVALSRIWKVFEEYHIQDKEYHLERADGERLSYLEWMKG